MPTERDTNADRAARQWVARGLASLGALACALAVGAAAYASHAADADGARRLAIAAAFAFGHGLALLALAPGSGRRLALFGLLALALGMVMFSGSLAGAALFGTPTAMAPSGGLLMMAGWAMLAVDALRRQGKDDAKDHSRI